MALISELEYERNRYYKLIENINLICRYLNSGNENINKAFTQLDKLYRVDDNKVDNDILKQTGNNINSIYQVLVEKIIPAIKRYLWREYEDQDGI